MLQLAIFVSQPSPWAMHCDLITNHDLSQSLFIMSTDWSIQVQTGSNRFTPPSSCLDIELNFGPVLKGSSLNLSSELNCGSTMAESQIDWCLGGNRVYLGFASDILNMSRIFLINVLWCREISPILSSTNYWHPEAFVWASEVHNCHMLWLSPSLLGPSGRSGWSHQQHHWCRWMW